MNLSNSDIKAITGIKTYIESGPASHETVHELCKIAGLKESKLTQGFKFLFQLTIHQYQLAVSMEYAKCLLDEDKTVKEVAISLGYDRVSHFTRSFVGVFGMPPSTIKLKK